MERDERYEVSSSGSVVVGTPVTLTPTERKNFIQQMFSIDGWHYTLLEEISQSHFRIKLENKNLDVSREFHLYHGNVRKEDPERNREEKKIQLGTENDPREHFDNSIILGFYVYEHKDQLDDAVIVAWPIEEDKNYPMNPSLRVNMRNDILPAKNMGYYIDTVTGKRLVAFRPEFIYHYIENYKKIQYGAQAQTQSVLTALTPEWFRDKAKEFAADDSEAAAMYIDFKNRFGPEVLANLSGEDLLKNLFLGASSDNVCHELEYVARNTELFGSVKGGNAFKYPMFYDKEASMWTSGTRANPKQLTLDEAIIKGTTVRDGLVKGAEIIESSLPIDSVEDYLTLYADLYSAIPELVDSLWVIKYFHMLFPDLLPVFYNKDWQFRVLTALKMTPNDTAYGRLGQINMFVQECQITNVAFARVFHKYCRNISIDEVDEIGVDEVVAERLTGGTNIILYGVPGAGKSWTIKHEYCDDESRMERLVFHPDYTYSDFVGQILPKVADDGSVSYEFSAGPFTKLVRKAYINPDKMYYLVIEEVNRGNAPAIFGDIFQLLDRDKDGSSEYEITNADIAKVVYLNDGHKVSIPSNMCILCTMNTSDQNVFTLDTAFQRRWNMRLIKNRFHDEADELRFAGTKILDTDVTWEHFFTEINDFILGKNIRMTSSEDKRLGTHFVSEEDLSMGDGSERQISRFPEKVLKYLWDDAFKFTKEDVFDLEKVKSLEDVIDLFVSSTGNERFLVFKENIYKAIVPQSSQNNE